MQSPKISPRKHIEKLSIQLEAARKSAKCNSVQKPHANLPDTPVPFTSASKYFQMLPGPPGAFVSTHRLCKSILRSFWTLMQLWMCILNTTRFDYYDSQMLERVIPPRSSVGDSVPNFPHSRSYDSIRTGTSSILSLLQSKDSLPHNMACIISLSLYVQIWSIWPQMVVEYTRKSTLWRLLREPSDQTLGSRCGETTEIKTREPTIIIPAHVSWYWNWIWEWERFLLQGCSTKVGRYHTTRPRGKMQLRRATKSRQEQLWQKVWEDRMWIFILWQDEMRVRWCLSTTGSHEFILRKAHFTCITASTVDTNRSSIAMYLGAVSYRVQRCILRPGSLELGDTLLGRERTSLLMQLETGIDITQRYSPTPSLSEFRDSIGDRHCMDWEMHLEAVIEGVWRHTRRLGSSEYGYGQGGWDRAGLEMQLEIDIEWTERCTCSLWSIGFGDAIGYRDWVNSEMHREAVIEGVGWCIGDWDWVNSEMHLEALLNEVWRFTGRPKSG